jgi:diacylglycerol kinase (ATP)
VVDTIRRSIELRGLPAGHPDRRAAIIYNPTKVLDFPLFRRRVDHALLHSGWKSPLWLETTREDPGRRMAREALAHHVDLVLVAGGDGTVRAVCAGLAGSGIPVGLVPAGTGNLLCRNLGIPLDEDVAIEVALHGVPTAIDMVSCTTDTGSDTFAVMAGVGLDALIMSETNPELKRAMRGGAYVVAAAQQVRMKPFGVRVTLDGQDLGEQPAVMALVGNVGRLQGGIQMFPEASPTDGLLDVLVASPDGLRDWARVAAGVRTGGPVRGLARAQGSRVEITVDRPIAFQLDGDTEGDAMRFVAEVVPGALRVMLTREPPGSSRPARDTAR